MTTTLIDDHREEIADLCRTYGVRRLDVFGSAVRGDFEPERSDVDFVFEFEEAPERNRFHDYMDLKEGLTRLLGRPVRPGLGGSHQEQVLQGGGGGVAGARL